MITLQQDAQLGNLKKKNWIPVSDKLAKLVYLSYAITSNWLCSSELIITMLYVERIE